MSLPLLIALVVAQGQTTPPTTHLVVKPIPQTPVTQVQAPPPPTATPVAPAAQPFSTPFVIADQDRLAITPKIDGKIDDEEWDPLSRSADMQSFFQWEPGKLYIAAIVPAGHDVIASFDINANGWLHGKDNLEIRIGNVQGQPTIVARVMDGTGIDGPRWIDIPGFSLSSVAAISSSGGSTVYEASIGDPGLGILPTEKGTKMLMRVDDPLSTDPPALAYLPRALSPVTLVMSRNQSLQKDLSFRPEGVGRSSVAGEATRVRMAFNGSNAMKLQKLEMHTLGPSKNDTIQITVPFPKFDDKGRSYVDYATNIMDGSQEGYRVLRGTLTTTDGVATSLECSYRVGPPVDFELVKQFVPIAALDRSLKFAFYAKSNSSKRVVGDVTIVVPDPLKVLNGAERNIEIYTNRGQDREAFELFLPPNIKGTFPIRFVSTINGKKFEQKQFITVGGL